MLVVSKNDFCSLIKLDRGNTRGRYNESAIVSNSRCYNATFLAEITSISVNGHLNLSGNAFLCYFGAI